MTNGRGWAKLVVTHQCDRFDDGTAATVARRLKDLVDAGPA